MDWSYLSKFVLGTIWWGMFSYILVENGYKHGSNCYSAFSYKFLIPSPWRSLILYSSIWIILIIHLLIIKATTWVFVPSNTSSGLLWVEVTKAGLFRGLLHINMARVLVVEHLMRRQQLFLKLLYRYVSVCSLTVLIFFLWEAMEDCLCW